MSAVRLHANDRGTCGVFMKGKADFCRACGRTQACHRRVPCSSCGGEFRPTRMLNVNGFSSCEEHRS